MSFIWKQNKKKKQIWIECMKNSSSRLTLFIFEIQVNDIHA